MKRTDIHRPSAIVPSEYVYVCFQYPIEGMEDVHAILEMRKQLEAHMAKTGGCWAQTDHAGSCFICGAWAKYLVVWHHRPSNTYIKSGEDCAQKMDMSVDGDFSLFRKLVKAALEQKAGKKKAQAILEKEGLQRCWEIANSEENEMWHNEEFKISDIVGKLIRYGSLSDKQLGFLRTLLARIDERPAKEAARKAEAEAAAPCPSGRIEIVGNILSIKSQESDFGVTLKMLVKAESGFKVWGTIPSGLNAYVKDKVRFTATVEPSRDDTKFGFFKRPAKAELLEAVAEEHKKDAEEAAWRAANQ